MKKDRRFYFPSIKRVIYLGISTVSLLLLFELGGQLFYRITEGHFLHQNTPEYKRIYQNHPYRSVALRKSANVKFRETSISTNELGFRTTGNTLHNSSSGITIVCLGGSTTFGSRVNDEESWPYLLQKELGESYTVHNLGGPGYSTMEAIVLMATTVHDMNPDIIINYHGWNDIRNYHIENPTPDYYAHGMFLKNALPTERTLKSMIGFSSILHYTGFFSLKKKDLGPDGRPIPQVKTYKVPDPYEDTVYVRNIRTLQVMAHQQNALSIFIPQLLNDNEFLNSEVPSRSWTPHIDDQSMPVLMQHFNQLVEKNIIDEQQSIYLNEVVDSMAWGQEYFIDDGHFNLSGNRRFAKVLAEKIRHLEP